MDASYLCLVPGYVAAFILDQDHEYDTYKILDSKSWSRASVTKILKLFPHHCKTVPSTDPVHQLVSSFFSFFQVILCHVEESSTL